MTIDARALLDKHLAPLVERGVDAGRLPGASLLRDDLGLSSLDAVNLIMALEQELDAEISDPELAELRSIDDVVRLIERKRVIAESS
jgi:acyl carrier protein